jgi:hypothetical protein
MVGHQVVSSVWGLEEIQKMMAYLSSFCSTITHWQDGGSHLLSLVDSKNSPEFLY